MSFAGRMWREERQRSGFVVRHIGWRGTEEGSIFADTNKNVYTGFGLI